MKLYWFIRKQILILYCIFLAKYKYKSSIWKEINQNTLSVDFGDRVYYLQEAAYRYNKTSRHNHR